MPLNLQTLMPTAVTPTSQTVITDIDGDGHNEVIILDSSLKQLSILHQFTYGEFTLNGISPTLWPATDPGTTLPLWTSDTNTHWMTMWSASQATIPGGWGIEYGDVIIAADLDGDGIDELFIYNLTHSWWGVLKWEPITNQLQTIFEASMQPQSGPPVSQNQLVWATAPGDEYFVIPNMHGLVPAVPLKAVGLLLYNANTLAMGMVSYQAPQNPGAPGKFLQWWNHSGPTLVQWNLGAVPPLNNFYPGNFTSSTTPSVVVFNPSDCYIGLLTWDGTNFNAFPAQGGTVGGWRFDNNAKDQLQVADLDGDGLSEILIYNTDTQFLGVLEWDNTSKQFQCPWLQTGQIGSTPNWTIDHNDVFFCTNGSGGKSGQIYAYSPGELRVAVLSYQSGSFACQWSGSSLLPNNGWPVTGKDTFFAGSPWDSGSPALFTYSNQGPANSTALTLGAAAWNATTNSLQLASRAVFPIQAWSPAFVAAAPGPGFTPFPAGDQQAIYTYINKLFPVPGEPSQGIPIRTLYTNLVEKDKFQAFAGDLAPVTSPKHVPTGWPATVSTWTDADWHAVVNTIVAECNQVDTVYSLYDAISDVASALRKFQKADLDLVKQNIQKITSDNGSNVEYWLGQVFVMFLWGFAAGAGVVPGTPIGQSTFGVFFSMAASLAGSVLGYNPAQQQSYAVSDLELQIADMLVKSTVAKSVDLTAMLSDPTKMQICDGLSESEWAMLTSLPSTVQEPFSAADRISMYQQLLPAFFTIEISTDGPFLGPALYTAPNGLCYYINSGGLIKQYVFNNSDLYTDLFHTLNVSVDDFFLGNGPWAAIPRTFLQ